MDVKDLNLNFLKKISEPFRFLILFVILVIICLAYYFTIYSGNVAETKELDSQLEKLRQTYRQNKAVADNLPEFKREFAKTEIKLKEALTQLPDKKDLPLLMKSIALLLNDSGLQSQKFTPKSEKTEQFYARVPINLELTGTYHSFAGFCDNVSRLQRIVNLSNLSMSPVGKKDKGIKGENTLKIKCLLETFRFIEEKETKGTTSEKEKTPKGKKK